MSIADKGPLVIVMGAIIICLYGWVAQEFEENRRDKLELKQAQKASDRKLEAYQKYVQEEVSRKLDQSTRVIEENTLVLRELSRRMGDDR